MSDDKKGMGDYEYDEMLNPGGKGPVPIIRPVGNPTHPKMKTHKIGDTRKVTWYVKKSEHFRVEDTDDFVWLEEGSQVEVTEKFDFAFNKVGLGWHKTGVDFSTLKTPEDIASAELDAQLKRLGEARKIHAGIFRHLKKPTTKKAPQVVEEIAPLSRWHRFCIWMGWRKPTIPVAKTEEK